MTKESNYQSKLLLVVKAYRQAAEHLSKYRIRCGSCHKAFCTACSAEPYHLGKTCEEFKDFQEAKKCRFCLTKMVSGPASMKPAFQNVCRSQECTDIMATSCDKMLACGHPCGGFNGEE
jgi:hypothetical protein